MSAVMAKEVKSTHKYVRLFKSTLALNYNPVLAKEMFQTDRILENFYLVNSQNWKLTFCYIAFSFAQAKTIEVRITVQIYVRYKGLRSKYQ